MTTSKLTTSIGLLEKLEQVITFTPLAKLTEQEKEKLQKWEKNFTEITEEKLIEEGFEKQKVNMVSLIFNKHQNSRCETPAPASKKQRIRCEEKRNDLSSSYHRPFKGLSPVDLLKQKIGQIIEDSIHQEKHGCNPAKDPAPFLFLLQSTGYGKTRAVLELAKREKKVIYLLCKDLDNTCGSWRVPNALREIIEQKVHQTDEKLWERKWSKFLDAVIETAKSYKTIPELYKAQVRDDGSFGDFYEKLYINFKKKTFPSISPVRLQKSIMKRNMSNTGEESSESPSKKNVSFDNSDRPNYHDAAPITEDSYIVCLDGTTGLDEITGLDGNEKRCTVKFRAFRRVAKCKGIISIFSDTAASICTVMPANDRRSSHEGGGGSLGIFTKPLYEMNTFDLSYDCRKHEDDFNNLFCAGRPRWQSIYDCSDEEEEDTRLNLLIEKARDLLILHNPEEDQMKVEDYQVQKHLKDNVKVILPGYVAAFACRFSFGEQSKIAKLLAKNSLATVNRVSSDRNMVSSHYLSEPVLAEASARFTSKKEKMVCVLDNVHMVVLIGELKPPRGDCGEMCAAALLGFSMDHIRQKRGDMYMSKAVDLKAFLSIFGLDQKRNSITEILAGWKINFTHFVRSTRKIDELDLVLMWKRRMACYMSEGTRGIDLLIVIRHESKGHATLRVQVKNYHGKIYPGERDNILTKLHPSYCPPHVEENFSVGLLLSVNDIDKRCMLVDYNNYCPIDTEKSSGSSKEQIGKVMLQLVSTFPHINKHTGNKDVFTDLTEISKQLWNICSGYYSKDQGRVDLSEHSWDKSREVLSSGGG